ncbi:MAG: SDR family NAD(P)-dependent oxidoreductase [candidate division Zixibacteria bacterium]|nr:SDR family NAD(P)-dependent oxidoreductase [candidate division Zixibacteria bacterium]
MHSLDGKAVVVTGASRGIGRATAIIMASRGARVACLGRDEQALHAVVDKITADGGEAFFLCCDVREEWSVKRTIEDVHAQLETIDILINNAGLGISGAIESYQLKDWQTTIDTNLTGPFLLSRAVISVMKENKRGRIINVLSGAARNGIANMGAYCASKFGLRGLSESLGLELRNDGILVCSAFPGSTDTHFGGRDPQDEDRTESDIGKLSPWEVAEAIVSLCETNPNAWVSELVIRPLRPK